MTCSPGGTELDRLRRQYARWQRESGRSHFDIAKALGVSLSEVRRLVDERAAAVSDRWAS